MGVGDVGPRFYAQNMTDLPPAGWYTDPENPGQERWWNGAAWSDDRRAVVQTAVAAPPPPPYAAPGPVYIAAAPTPTKNGMATAGLVLALVSLLINPFAVLSILGIVFGAVGWSRAKSIVVNGKEVGSLSGGWAIIIGVLSTIWFVIQWQQAMQEIQTAFTGF